MNETTRTENGSKYPMSDQIKLIRHNIGGINHPDDPAFGPWKLEASFRVPQFMEVAAAMLYGSEQITIRGKTKEALEECVKQNAFDKHPRLIKLEITQPAPEPPEPKEMLGWPGAPRCNNGFDSYGYPQKPHKR